MSTPTTGAGGGLPLQELQAWLLRQQAEVTKQLNELNTGDPTLQVGKMMTLQLAMNMMSQISETSSNVASASNQMISSMARNLK